MDAQISNKDKGVRTTVQRLSNRYYTDKNVQCRNCSKNGHLSKNCPEPKKASPCFLCGTQGHHVAECPYRHCNNCGLPGHMSDSCLERAYWHKQCHRCGMTGHFFDACPEIWRQYHNTTKLGPPRWQEVGESDQTPAQCYNCSRNGHFGHSCSQKRMFNGTYPSTPFINHYDTMEDIKRRQHRLKFKVKDLKENGLFPNSSQAAVTPGPAKKKRKVNDRPNHHSPHTPNHNKAGPSHIIFRDDDSTPKMPKGNKAKWHKQESHGSAKPWKPKRPVPTKKDRPPQAKLVMDEAADFPRGRAKAGNTLLNKKRKMKGNPPKQRGEVGGGNKRGCVFGPGKGPARVLPSDQKKRKGKRNRNQKPGQKAAAEKYPTDENLFTIKQRRRKS
ncbi:zinc finger CCHC domain-containing protein 7-like [Genypterus blacodes]|uniref:zinc finger CCHC domain-containing protein 7-like n=1 Tax=Genypterus blacodes TaxID=154954 RepID=UPI003F75E1E1